MPPLYRIPFIRPNLVRKEAYLPYLERIDDSHWYSNFGTINSQFEDRIIDEVFEGLGAAATVCNATTGLMLAISRCKRPRGRYALMPSFTFAATPLAAIWCGLEPFYVDIREGDWAMREDQVSELVDRLGDKVAVVVPYTTFGTALPLGFYENLHKCGVPVVVDAAPALGTQLNGAQLGEGFPGFVIFSFHATKPFGIGEGGLIYSADVEAVAKIRKASNFGFSSRRVSELVGLNGKMSEYAAAIALATLDTFADKRRNRLNLYSYYLKSLKASSLTRNGWELQQADGDIPYQFLPLAAPKGVDTAAVVRYLADNGIEARTYFAPTCHEQPALSPLSQNNLQTTDAVSARALSLPFWEEMSQNEVDTVVIALKQFERYERNYLRYG